MGGLGEEGKTFCRIGSFSLDHPPSVAFGMKVENLLLAFIFLLCKNINAINVYG
jgi:hypothetical protein